MINQKYKKLILERRTISLFEKKVFERAIVTPPFKYPNLAPEKACFFYILEGSVNSHSEEEYFHIKENEGVLMKCGNYIYERLPSNETGKCEIVAIYLYPDVLKKIYEKEIPSFLKNKKQLSTRFNMAHVKSNILIKKYIEGISFYFENPYLINEELLILKFKEIILLLLNTKDAPTIIEIMHNLYSPRSFSFKEVIEAHVFSSLTVSDLAQLTNRSLARFNREFKKTYKDSPANYLKDKRLDRAAELLVISNEPIASIAYDCQFNNISHFSSSFKAKYKISPSKYRLNQIQK